VVELEEGWCHFLVIERDVRNSRRPSEFQRTHFVINSKPTCSRARQEIIFSHLVGVLSSLQDREVAEKVTGYLSTSKSVSHGNIDQDETDYPKD
jgi:hypothetical protein